MISFGKPPFSMTSKLDNVAGFFCVAYGVMKDCDRNEKVCIGMRERGVTAAG
jgi:hypothetical protein